MWDTSKAGDNFVKHGVSFTDAAVALDDPNAITKEDDRYDYGEIRYITLCKDDEGRLLVVVWTPRNDQVRMISARKANHRERQRY